MRAFIFAVVLVSATAGSAVARAEVVFPIEMACPVGGEKFVHYTTVSYSTWGQRPDGRPFGSGRFPTPLPECPSNGLPLFKEEFTLEEVSALTVLIETPEYVVLRAEETQYYRAWRLKRELEPDDNGAVWLLLRATWEAEEGTSRRSRYLGEFVRQVDAVPPSPEGGAYLRLLAVNALRELGDFEAAAERLSAWSSPPADRRRRRVDRAAADQAAALRAYAAELKTLLARRDASVEPLDMMPAREAAARCVDLDLASAPPIAAKVCTSKEVAALVAKVLRQRGTP